MGALGPERSSFRLPSKSFRPRIATYHADTLGPKVPRQQALEGESTSCRSMGPSELDFGYCDDEGWWGSLNVLGPTNGQMALQWGPTVFFSILASAITVSGQGQT